MLKSLAYLHVVDPGRTGPTNRCPTEANLEQTKTEVTGSEKLVDVLARVGSDELTGESFDVISNASFRSDAAFDELRSLLRDWSPVQDAVGSKGTAAVLKGYCSLLAADPDGAVEALHPQKAHPWGAYHLARSLFERGNLGESHNVASATHKKFEDFLPIAYLLVRIECRLGNTEAAESLLRKLEGADGDSGDFHYHRGVYLERCGEYAEAIAQYRRATQKDDTHAEAFFRLAYMIEIHGSDADEANDDAVAAYESCIKNGPVHTNAVINLGLLYEDRERYHDSIKCYETVLRYYPNHERAKLYLDDAHAATTMFYDREQEKKADRQSQVLKIPVTDFELSVRSRNCLQKMNIKTLGDLIMRTEQELLSYKNFGETSLEEIKQMLTQKGLRLGQGLDDGGRELSRGRNPLEATADPLVLERSIDELELSVRSRRCMERLGVRTIRDLINKTEVELMSAKNFGMTSLNEIKRKLAELNLELRS